MHDAVSVVVRYVNSDCLCGKLSVVCGNAKAYLACFLNSVFFVEIVLLSVKRKSLRRQKSILKLMRRGKFILFKLSFDDKHKFEFSQSSMKISV